MKRALLNLSLAGAAMFLSVLAFEAGLRVFYPQQEAMRWFTADARYGYVNRSNFSQLFGYPGFDYAMPVKTNSMGLRDVEYSRDVFEDPEITRVLLLGDSFTFGYGVDAEDTFDTQLEQRLNATGNRYVVLNAGVGGWGTVQETLYAKDHFAAFDPDVVVLTFCANDPDDDLKFELGMRDNDQGVVRFPGKTFLKNHSHVYQFLFKRFHVLLHNLALERKAAREHRDVELDAQSGSVVSAEDWSRTLETIREFHQDFLEFNPKGVLLVQATAPWNEDVASHLRRLSQGTHLQYVDLSPDTVAVSSDDRRLPHDGHWSVLMHSIAAERLSPLIRE